MSVRALTLQQPWAHAITRYGKRVENRRWAPDALHTLLIHAGQATDPYAAAFLASLDLPAPINPTVGAIVAVAELTDVCDAALTGRPCRCGQWAAPGQYHWRLAAHIHVLRSPVPARGLQRLWKPPAAVLAAITTPEPMPRL